MTLVSVLMAAVAVILVLPTVSDLLALAAVAIRPVAPPRGGQGEDPTFLFLVPAHNESLLIQDCVRSLTALDHPPDRMRVVVIADNCTDDTAALARQAGAHVLERHDLERRGKPWALAWAMEQEELGRWDAVVIVDADTLVDPGFARAMAAHRPLRSRAIQGSHESRNTEDNALTRMGAVLATAFYRFMYPLRSRSGLSVPLTGNGMCIGTDILRSRGWRAFSIAEDTELYVDLTRGGYRVEVEPDAVVRSQAAKRLSQGTTQRTRWRAGRLAVLRRLGPSIAAARDLGFRQKLDILGELLAPGPIVTLGVAGILAIATLLLRPPGWSGILVLLLLPIVRMAIYTLLAIRRQPDPWKALLAFAYLPVYLPWRLGVEVLAFLTDGDRAWIRTERHAEVPAEAVPVDAAASGPAGAPPSAPPGR